jgi:hypothetical protein
MYRETLTFSVTIFFLSLPFFFSREVGQLMRLKRHVRPANLPVAESVKSLAIDSYDTSTVAPRVEGSV